MIHLKRVPWSLWAFSGILLVGTILVDVEAHGPILAKVMSAALMLGWLYFLLKGARWIWFVTVGISILGLLLDVPSVSRDWRGVATTLIGLMLLLLPVTRRYFAGDTGTAGP
ncbi:MAG TPA: hypothetical protein VGC49_01025 [Solirubrobacterales bacterium]